MVAEAGILVLKGLRLLSEGVVVSHLFQAGLGCQRQAGAEEGPGLGKQAAVGMVGVGLKISVELHLRQAFWNEYLRQGPHPVEGGGGDLFQSGGKVDGAELDP